MDTLQTVLTNIVAVVPAWLLQGLFTVIAAAIGSFGGAYLKTRGSNLATRSDFANLQSQLRANTELTEKIKAEVGQLDWTQREWTNLRRIKLEALLDKLRECEEYIDDHRSNSAEGNVVSRELGSQLDAIQVLYFPELATKVGAYLAIYNTAISAGSTLAFELLRAGTNEYDRKRAYDKYQATATTSEFFKIKSLAVNDVKFAARELLVKIMGVADPAVALSPR